jgi:hypothetical protein
MAANNFVRVIKGSPVDPDLWHNPVAEAVTALQTSQQAGPWTTFTLLNGWTNRGSGFPAAAYRNPGVPLNSVEIIGQIIPGTKTDGTVLFTLPVGLRPTNEVAGLSIFAQPGPGGAANLQIQPDGDCVIINVTGTATLVQICVLFPLDAPSA